MPGRDCPLVARRYLARDMIFCVVAKSMEEYIALSIPDVEPNPLFNSAKIFV
jgi:hypothetical protein